MHRSFEDDLEKLRTRLIRMGSIVEEQVDYAFRVLFEANVGLAHVVVERDDKVDRLDIKIDKQVQRLFALQQPVASDLRLLLSAIRINNEFETIGDIALEIVRPVLSEPKLSQMATEFGLERMTQATFRMLKASVDAFINNDSQLARHILPTDNTVDSLDRDICKRIMMAMRQDVELVDPGVRLITIVKAIERLADHAASIAENVIFLVEARLVRHRFTNQGSYQVLESDNHPEDADSDF